MISKVKLGCREKMMIEERDASSAFSPHKKSLTAAILIGTTFVVVPTSTANDYDYDYYDNFARHAKLGGAEQSKNCGSSNNSVSTYLNGWIENAPKSSWYFDLAQRLKVLASKKDGWKGIDSLAALPEAHRHASDMLNKLAQEGIDRRPSIGLDYEGTFSLSWLDDSINVDLTVYEDGSYSFFASSKETRISVDEAKLSDPLHGRLLSVLLS